MAVILTVALIIFMEPGLSLAQSVNTWLWEAANSDRVAGQEDAVHEFTLDLHTALGEDGCIEITFPVEFQIPEVAEGTDVGTEIEISGLAAGDDISDTTIEIDNNTVFITLGAGDSLAEGNDLTITFTSDAARTNPAVPGAASIEVHVAEFGEVEAVRLADWGPKDTRTEWVTLTAENVDIMITIGETDIQVTENGVKRTVESDAAAQIRTGRTVLPLRALGEILGAEFDYHPKDAPVVWVNFLLSN